MGIRVSLAEVTAIQPVHAFTDSFSGECNAALWHVDALSSAPEWNEARRLAGAALDLLLPENTAE